MKGAVASGIMVWLTILAGGGSLKAAVVSGLAGLIIGGLLVARHDRP